MKIFYSGIILFILQFYGYPQNINNNDLLDHVKNVPYHLSTNVKTLAEYLIKPVKSEKEKLEVFYYWIAENIAYDTQSYVSGNYNESDAQTTLNLKKAICQGYSNLFKSLCDEVGIKCYVINGYAKGFSYNQGDQFNETNHAWNTVYIDNKWQLIDATWGSGYVEYNNGKLEFTKKIKMEYFLSPPEEFIEKHLPANPMWQLIEYPVSLENYVKYSNIEELLKTGKNYFNYKDSIQIFESLSIEEQKVKEAESIYNFYPVDTDLLALYYYNYAVYLSTNYKDQGSLQKSLKYYYKAKVLYQESKAENASQMLQYCDQGIEYAEYYLNK